MTRKRCVMPGCDGVSVGRGYCRKHYTRFKRYGDPTIVYKPRPKGPSTRKIDFYVNESGCFICTSHSRDKDGYPRIAVNKKHYRLSRFIYEQCFGEIPPGLVVRHKCDTPECINPEHLEIGTNADNVRDKVIRGRSVRFPGSSNPASKLTEYQVLEIKVLLSKGESMSSIARRFNVSRKAIAKIRNGETWAHISDEKGMFKRWVNDREERATKANVKSRGF